LLAFFSLVVFGFLLFLPVAASAQPPKHWIVPHGIEAKVIAVDEDEGRLAVQWTVHYETAEVEKEGSRDFLRVERETLEGNMWTDKKKLLEWKDVFFTELGRDKYTEIDYDVVPGKIYQYLLNNTYWGYDAVVEVYVHELHVESLSGESPAGGNWGSAEGDPWHPNDKGGHLERALAWVISFPLRMLANLAQMGGFETLDKLVFQEGLTDEEMRYRPWNPSEWNSIMAWYQALCVFTVPFFILVIVITAFKLKYAALNPPARADAVESVQRWFLAVGIVILAPLLVLSLVWVASLLAKSVGAAFNYAAAGLGRNVSDWASVDMLGGGIATGSILGTTLVKIFLVGMFFYLNLLYIIRKFVMTVMFAFTPLMAILWAVNRNTTAAAIWLGELASNAFMPVAHGLALGTLLLICDVRTYDTSWLTFLVMFMTVVPAAEALRNSLQSLFTRWAGIHEESIVRSAALGALGLGGILSLGRVAGATLRGGKGSVFRGTPGSSGPQGGPLSSSGTSPGPAFGAGGMLAPSTVSTSSAGSPSGTSPGPASGAGGMLAPSTVSTSSAGSPSGTSSGPASGAGGMLAPSTVSTPSAGSPSGTPPGSASKAQSSSLSLSGTLSGPASGPGGSISGGSSGKTSSLGKAVKAVSRGWNTLDSAWRKSEKASHVASKVAGALYSPLRGLPGGEVVASMGTAMAGLVGRATVTAVRLGIHAFGQTKVGQSVAGRLRAFSQGLQTGENFPKTTYPSRSGGLDEWRA
jgi:hypothetical protein